MDNLVEYANTKNITYAHAWLEENKQLIKNIVRHVRHKHNLQHMSEEDLLQEAYVLYYSVITHYNPLLSKPYTFLYLALSNALLSKVKELGREDMAYRMGMLDLDYEYPDTEISLSDIVPGDSGDHTKEILINSMREYVATHCDERMQLVYSMYAQGFSNTEIGKKIGVTKWMITLMLRKLINEMKEELKIYGNEEL